VFVENVGEEVAMSNLASLARSCNTKIFVEGTGKGKNIYVRGVKETDVNVVMDKEEACRHYGNEVFSCDAWSINEAHIHCLIDTIGFMMRRNDKLIVIPYTF